MPAAPSILSLWGGVFPKDKPMSNQPGQVTLTATPNYDGANAGGLSLDHLS